jgi:hypothetical protein
MAATASCAATTVCTASKTACIGRRAEFAMRATRHRAVHLVLSWSICRFGLIDVVELLLNFIVLIRPGVCMRGKGLRCTGGPNRKGQSWRQGFHACLQFHCFAFSDCCSCSPANTSYFLNS